MATFTYDHKQCQTESSELHLRVLNHNCATNRNVEEGEKRKVIQYKTGRGMITFSREYARKISPKLHCTFRVSTEERAAWSLVKFYLSQVCISHIENKFYAYGWICKIPSLTLHWSKEPISIPTNFHFCY